MDKYERQSQKSKLWARRRNTTADLLLDGQLRYLERQCRQELKQHLRSKSRIQEELRGLLYVSDDAGLDQVTFGNPKKLSVKLSSNQVHYDPGISKRKPDEKIHSKISRPQTSPTREMSLEIRSPSIKSLETDHGLENNNCHKIDRTKSETSFLNNAHLSERASNADAQRSNQAQLSSSSKERSFSSLCLESSEKSTKTTCRFNRDRRNPKRPCKHFPCSVPNTYHALGFRRDDIGQWFLGKEHIKSDNTESGRGSTDETSSCKLVETSTKKSRNKVDTSFYDLPTNQKSCTRERFDNVMDLDTVVCGTSDNVVAESIPTEMQWSSKTPPKKGFSFRPKSGPAFGPKPPDPILENVRSEVTRVLKADKQPPRMTVAGRMRGLKSLIMEMREKQERSKPVDWAVNYGQRLPMRVLLNPVVPVSI